MSAIVALKRHKQEWIPSIDFRSFWKLENKKLSSGEYIYTYRIFFINDIPKELGQNLSYKKIYKDDVVIRTYFQYPQQKVEQNLKRILQQNN